MDTLTITLKTITPLFLGGANPNETAELRASSIKGVLRFWYRAIDPDYNKKVNPAEKNSPTWEEKIFGSAEHGQGEFSIRLKSYNHSTFGFKKEDYSLLDEGFKRNTKNGMIYLGFPLESGRKERGNYQQRKFIKVGETIEFDLIFRKVPDEKTKKSILAALWLLGHIGGLGSRSRRGFGTVALQLWTCQWPDLDLLHIAHEAKSFNDWLERFKKGIKTLKDWFQRSVGFQVIDHTVLEGNNTKFYLFKNGQRGETKTKTVRGRTESKYFQPWEIALNEAGLVMQKFRQRWKLSNPNSDYPKIKEHLAYIDNNAAGKWGITPNKLSIAPQRTAFGLPLTFQSSYQEGFKKDGRANYITVSTIFEGEKHERNASPIHIRIININGACHPLYIWLNAPFLDDKERVKDKHGSYPKPSTTILKDFWKYMINGNKGEIITW
ncbi:MAG: hypothetical protein DDT22_00610 [candidate division WS2 bacterium]|nr:hypothetical protein [Candidatus Lithacetigena glycinireducens]